MRLSAFFYVFKAGVKNIFRNKLFSLASVVTMITCIFLFGCVYSIVTNINHMVREVEQGVAITAFFDEDCDETQINKIGNEIKALSGVADITFISAEEAWETFKQDYFSENETLASGFEEDNPLANSANYQVTLKDVAKQKTVAKDISEIEGIRKVNSSESLADTLTGFNSLLSYFSMAIIILLLVVSVFLISNTISVGVNVRKEEIAIMKLMGAKNSFVRAPFLIEGVLLGIVGAGIPLAVLAVIYDRTVNLILTKYGVLAGFLKFLPASSIFVKLLPMGLAIGVAVGFMGSLISIRKHLRV